MIECVFFDYDGVLTLDRTGSTTTCRYVSQAAKIPFERVQAAFAPHNRSLTLGHTTHERVWSEICNALGADIPIEVLLDAFDSAPMNHAMFDLAKDLRSVCRIGIITDNKSDRMQRLRRVQKLDEVFDPIIVSAEVGLSKSSSKLFEYALSAVALSGPKTVFIDNDHENVAKAAEVGMHAVYFDEAANDVFALVAHLRRAFSFPGP